MLGLLRCERQVAIVTSENQRHCEVEQLDL